MKKLFILLAFILLLGIPTISSAFELRADNTVKLKQEEIADGNIYASCNNMVIDGVVNGDIFAVCKNINISGIVNGDLIAFSENITINGEIKGSVRVAGTKLNVNGTVGHNINALGTEINLSPTSNVIWDVLVAGANGMFNGNIGGNLHGVIGAANISGKVGKNIDLKIDNNQDGGLLITKDAVIAGNLDYSSKQEATIESPSTISGKINHQEIKNKEKSPVDYLSKIFFTLSALVLIALVLISLSKKIFYSINDILEKKYWQSALIGLAIFLLTPLVVIFFTFTLIGLPLAIIILFLYLVVIPLAIIFSSFSVSNLIFKKLIKKTVNPYITLITGLLIFALITQLPYVSSFFYLIYIIGGLGSSFLIIKNKQNA